MIKFLLLPTPYTPPQSDIFFFYTVFYFGSKIDKIIYIVDSADFFNRWFNNKKMGFSNENIFRMQIRKEKKQILDFI